MNWPKQTKESWLARILKDNPHTQKTDYFIQTEDGLTSDPFTFFTDLPSDKILNMAPIVPKEWKIGTQIFLSDPEKAIAELRLVLENGIEYLTINILQNQNEEELKKIFKNIHLDFIQTTWLFPDHFENFKNVLDFILRHTSNPHRYICHTQNNFFNNNLDTAQFSVHQFKSQSISEVLFEILKNISDYGSRVKNVILKVYLTDDFLRNIYTLRALRIVLQNIKELFSLNLDFKIEGRIHPAVYGEDQHNNLIIASTLSSSAILSGIDFLIPELPLDGISQNDWGWKKSSIHLQQILKQESKLNGLIEPVSGSYYLDNMTLKCAQALWSALQEKIIK